jgi:hypothetical protein
MDMGKAPLVKMDTESFYNKKRPQARAAARLGEILWRQCSALKNKILKTPFPPFFLWTNCDIIPYIIADKAQHESAQTTDSGEELRDRDGQ